MYPLRKNPINWILLVAFCLLAFQISAPLYAQDATATVAATMSAETPTEIPLPELTEAVVEAATASPVPEQTEAPLEPATETPTLETTEALVEAATATSMPAPTDAPTEVATATPTVELPTATITPTIVVETPTPLPQATEAPVEPATATPVTELPTATSTSIATVEIPTATPLPEQMEAPVEPATATPIVKLPTATSTVTATAEMTTTMPLPEQTETATPLVLATMAPTAELPTATAILVMPTLTPTTVAELPTATPIGMAELPTITPTPEAVATIETAAELNSMNETEQLAATVVEQPSFALTLNGRDQAIDATMSILLTDMRAENSGWSLQIAAMPKVDPSTGRTLQNVALTIPDVAVECAQQPCTLPADTVRGGMVPLNSFAMEPVTFFNAAPETGAGELMISPTLRLHVPATAYAGDYQVTVVVTIVSGP